MNEEHLKYNKFALTVIGLWPLNSQKSQLINKIHFVYGYVIITYFVLFVITEYIEIIRNLGESLSDIVTNLTVSLLYTVTLFKMKFCKSAQVRGFVQYIRNAENAILEGIDDELKTIYRVHAKWNRKLNILFISLTTMTILPFFINPVISELTNPIESYTELVDNKTMYVERPLPFSSWFPFDKYKHYSVSFVLQTIAGTIGASLTCITDILFWGFMIFGIGQIKILQHKLTNFKGDGLKYADANQVDSDEATKAILKKCIVLHQILIAYIKSLDNSIKHLMLMDFGICSMQIGAIGFQAIVSGFGWSQVFATEYLLAMLIQMFLFYWHANEILLESMRISIAIWQSEFHDCSVSVQKTLRFVMMRAQKPLTLNVGPFYAMSTNTAISIVRASYSYVALMRQVYK